MIWELVGGPKESQLQKCYWGRGNGMKDRGRTDGEGNMEWKMRTTYKVYLSMKMLK